MKKFTDITESWLVTVNKDLPWLLEQTGYTIIAWRNWKKEHKNPSLDAINSIALALKNAGANIWTPKQLMPQGMKFSTGRTNARTNIAWIIKNYNISMPELYNNKKFGLAKNSIANVVNQDKHPNYTNLLKFTKAFKMLGKGNIQSPVDLVYFPIPWGESEISYLEIRNKIKIID